ncbi:hypothetical protein [Legionella waltersii]|uniref:hypothetical protein n=1 Tax=Legionella waltersii TaxID=66969 RepID=UPI000A8E2EF5|nr:hypothetical protein [Legionella waltersii]
MNRLLVACDVCEGFLPAGENIQCPSNGWWNGKVTSLALEQFSHHHDNRDHRQDTT